MIAICDRGGAVLRIDYLSVAGLPPLSFEVAPGQCLAIEGPSGSGKTRLLRAIADLDPAEGYVFLEGVERSEMPAPLWRRRVRFVAAESAWWAPTARAHFPATARLDRRPRPRGPRPRPAGGGAFDRRAPTSGPGPRARG